MKRVFSFFLILSVIVSCSKEEGTVESCEEKELDIPEQIEADIIDVLSKDWATLADTLGYFKDNLLLKGKMKGYGPDSVYYELDFKSFSQTLNVRFSIADSLWINAYGAVDPLLVNVFAYSTYLGIGMQDKDSVLFTVNSLSVKAPLGFGIVEDKTCTMYYLARNVGYIDFEEFENEDYSTGKYMVLHYNDDPRTFSFYDGGFGRFINVLDEIR